MEGKKKRTTLVNAECVQTAKGKLSELGKNNAGMINKRAAVKSVKAQIKAARARGVGWAEIIETLAGAGIDISLRTLKTEIESGTEKVGKKEGKKTAKGFVKPAEVKQVVQSGGAYFEIKPDSEEL